MGLLPKNQQGKINLFQSKIDPWTTNAVAIGTTTTAVGALDTLVTAAQTAIANRESAQAAAKTASAVADQAIEAMTRAGMNIVSAIRTKALTSGPSVYNLAEIPAPATPSWPGDPGTPYKFAAQLNALGGLDISWKCTNPAGGTMYAIWRKIGDAPAVQIGGCGGKKFVDSTLPAGTSLATYQIQAQRTTGAGAWATFVVNIGVGTSGATTTSVSPSAVKIAA